MFLGEGITISLCTPLNGQKNVIGKSSNQREALLRGRHVAIASAVPSNSAFRMFSGI